MVNIIRLFVAIGAVVSVVLTITITAFAWSLVSEELESNINARNNTIANNLSLSVVPFIEQLTEKAALYRSTPTRLLDTPIAADLKNVITQATYGNKIVEVNILDKEGIVIFSTRSVALLKRRKDAGFESAISGNTFSDYQARHQSSYAASPNVLHVYTTYAPVIKPLSDGTVGHYVLSVSNDFTASHIRSAEAKTRIGYVVVMGTTLAFIVLCICLMVARKYFKRYENQIDDLEQALERKTFIDPVTGLPNRRQFMQRLDHLLDICRRVPHESFALIITDLDSFKVVNESLGHHAGNDLLKQVSNRLSAACGENHMIARLGGDEFGIILESTNDAASAIQVAKRIHQKFDEKFLINSHEVTETTSIGIVLLPPHEERGALTSAELIRDADIAMYRAKNRGRGHYEIFNKHMHVEAMRRIEIENDIRRGISENEFFCRYHPIVCVESNRVCSLEALVRWEHPTKRELSPDKFVPVAEEIGLVENIDRYVLTDAVDQLSKWRNMMPDHQDLSINVNHSARNFNSRHSMDNIFTSLENSGIEGNGLKIELTESSILNNEMMATGMFEELRNHGIHLCMDDFGTGFSSLSYLRKWRFDMLKIDQSFVRDMQNSDEARKIVHTIIEMGNHLGLDVTAEGVETKAQLDMLRDMGCRYAQGYYFCKPLRAEDVMPFIKNQDTLTLANTTEAEETDLA